VASSFEHLRDFIQKRMRMAHIYQPVMIKELLTHRGRASIRNIAAAFLARDASQIEYYEQITKDMPGIAKLQVVFGCSREMAACSGAGIAWLRPSPGHVGWGL
jgi:hypothetical protein